MLGGAAADQEARAQHPGDVGELGLAVEARNQGRQEIQHDEDDAAYGDIQPEQGADFPVTDLGALYRGGGEAQILEQLEQREESGHHGDQPEGGRRQQARQERHGGDLRHELDALRHGGDGSAPQGTPEQIVLEMIDAEMAVWISCCHRARHDFLAGGRKRPTIEGPWIGTATIRAPQEPQNLAGAAPQTSDLAVSAHPVAVNARRHPEMHAICFYRPRYHHRGITDRSLC